MLKPERVTGEQVKDRVALGAGEGDRDNWLMR